MRAHLTDQGKGTDADGVDGEGQLGDSGIAEREHRGKGIDDVGSDGCPAKLPENQGWLTQSGQPSARLRNDDIGG